MQHGKIIFIKPKEGTNSESLSNVQEVNCNLNFLNSLQTTPTRAIALTKEHELFEWSSDSDKQNLEENKNHYNFLLQKPIYIVDKTKFAKIYLNSTVTMGINFHGTLFAWGENKAGLLGLGYNITELNYPTEILANIKELSISENHAVSIDFDGEVYSWGSGKYGELCQDKRIYSSYPTKKTHLNSSYEDLSMNITNVKNLNSRKFNKVFCADNLTCFIDDNGNFSYFGVISASKSEEIKNMLTNSIDPNIIFQEKFLVELEKEKFIQVSIGNGFLALLSEKGTVFTVGEKDNINSLYSKYCVYSIGISNNQLFGLCKITNNSNNNNNISNINNNSIYSSPIKQFLTHNNFINNRQTIPFLNINNNPNTSQLILNKTDDEESFSNLDNTQNPNLNLNQNIFFFLCRWSPEVILNNEKNEKLNDSWTTNIYQIITEETELDNILLLNSVNKDVLFLILNINNQQQNLNENKKSTTPEKDNNKSINKQNFNSSVMMNISNLKKQTTENIQFILIGCFDDSFNLKYKRVKGNYQGIKNVNLDKSDVKNDFLKDDILNITEKLNRSITKRQKLNRLNIMEYKNKQKGDKSLLEKEKNNQMNSEKNIFIQDQSNNNISIIDSDVNYLRSPEKLSRRKNEEVTTKAKSENKFMRNYHRSMSFNVCNLENNLNVEENQLANSQYISNTPSDRDSIKKNLFFSSKKNLNKNNNDILGIDEVQEKESNPYRNRPTNNKEINFYKNNSSNFNNLRDSTNFNNNLKDSTHFQENKTNNKNLEEKDYAINKSQNLFKNKELNLSPNFNVNKEDIEDNEDKENNEKDKYFTFKKRNSLGNIYEGTDFKRKKTKIEEEKENENYNDTNESNPIDENKIIKEMDINSKIIDYNKNLNFSTFSEEKNIALEKVKKINEKNNSIIIEDSIHHRNNSNSYMSHRKFSLEQKIKELQMKLDTDLNDDLKLDTIIQNNPKEKDESLHILKLKAVEIDTSNTNNEQTENDVISSRKYSSLEKEKNIKNSQNDEINENINFNIMSTNRTLNSQVISNRNIYSKLAFNNLRNSNVELNNKNNIDELKSIKKDSFTKNEISNENKLKSSLTNSSNYKHDNLNFLKNPEEYYNGFEILIKIYKENDNKFNEQLRSFKKIYFLDFINEIRHKNSLKESSFSRKSSKSGRSIVSDRYEKTYQEEDQKISPKENSKKLTRITSPLKKFEEKITLNKINNFDKEKNKNNNENKNFQLNLDDSNQINSENYLTSPTNIRNNYSNNSIFLKYPTNKIKESSFEQESSSINSSKTNNLIKNENVLEKNKKEDIIKYNCGKEILYLAKILVKNISQYQKITKKDLFKEFNQKAQKFIKWNRLSHLLNKNILLKHYLMLDRYFSKLRKINKINSSVEKLSFIFGKFLNSFFELFSNKTRVLQLKRKYLDELMLVLNRINIRQKKFLLFENLENQALFNDKLPNYKIFCGKLFKLMKRNVRKNAFISIKKFYYSMKIFMRNIEYFMKTISSFLILDKRIFFVKFKINDKTKICLKNLITKKQAKNTFFIKKAFKRYMENTLNYDDCLYIRIKLNKCFKIYAYHLKLQSVKVNK